MPTEKEYRYTLLQMAAKVAFMDLPSDPKGYYLIETGDGDIQVMIVVTTRKARPLQLVPKAEHLASSTAHRRIGHDQEASWVLSEKDLHVIEIVRVEPGLLTKEIAKRMGVSPRNTDLRARLANLSARHVLVSSANRGYCVGPKAPLQPETQPPAEEAAASTLTDAPRPAELQGRPDELQFEPAATDATTTIV